VNDIRLGTRENLSQFSLLVVVNALVGGMVGMERSILPALGQQEFHLAARATILSFIVVFGVTQAATNYAAGGLSDRFGRNPLLVAGWLTATPFPFLLVWASGRSLFVGTLKGMVFAWSPEKRP
jgi:MFS family permease